ncbi:hypothetical protein AMTRI_Chr11g158940 [Amborella trichopoda]
MPPRSPAAQLIFFLSLDPLPDPSPYTHPFPVVVSSNSELHHGLPPIPFATPLQLPLHPPPSGSAFPSYPPPSPPPVVPACASPSSRHISFVLRPPRFSVCSPLLNESSLWPSTPQPLLIAWSVSFGYAHSVLFHLLFSLPVAHPSPLLWHPTLTDLFVDLPRSGFPPSFFSPLLLLLSRILHLLSCLHPPTPLLIPLSRSLHRDRCPPLLLHPLCPLRLILLTPFFFDRRQLPPPVLSCFPSLLENLTSGLLPPLSGRAASVHHP